MQGVEWMKNTPEQTWSGRTEEDIDCVLKKADNWYSPGIR